MQHVRKAKAKYTEDLKYLKYFIASHRSGKNRFMVCVDVYYCLFAIITSCFIILRLFFINDLSYISNVFATTLHHLPVIFFISCN